MCVSGDKKCLFFGSFGVLCFLETPGLRFVLLPYYGRVGCVRLKVTFLHGKLYANYRKFKFLVKTAVKFRNLRISKVLNTDTNRIFPILFKITYISLEMYNLKNNLTVSRSGYLYGVSHKLS